MILCVRTEACGASEGAGLELLIRQLQGHPGVEHGGPQLAPHPVIGQAEDLGGKLSGGLGGQDGGATQTCREKEGGALRVADTRGTKRGLGLGCTHRSACGGRTRHPVPPSPE